MLANLCRMPKSGRLWRAANPREVMSPTLMRRRSLRRLCARSSPRVGIALAFDWSCFERSNTMDWRSRIVSDAAVARGAACIRGTRIPVSVVLDNLAAGLSAEEVILSYPSLSLDDVRASLAYGAGLARER